MAKHCSSSPRACPRRRKSPGPRIFKNTWVRNGQSNQIHGWSARIQFQGVRKTFSLKAPNKTSASEEARAIHQLIHTQGWEAALALHKPPVSPSFIPYVSNIARDDPSYWKQRLIRRKYTEPLQPASLRALSVRIGDELNQGWFPLNTEAEDAAALKALEIFRVLKAEGWPTVCAKYSREVTVAIFWALSPVAITYTTLYTLLSDDSPAPAERGPFRKVAIIDPDPGIQRALTFWLHRQPGIRCTAAVADPKKLSDLPAAERPDLIFFNRSIFGVEDLLQTYKKRWPGAAILPYDTADHIDDVFTSLTGVRAGYIFQRRIPSEILEPIQSVLRQETFSADSLDQYIKDYFSNLFNAAPATGPGRKIANLTSREFEVLNLLSKGSVDKEIAEALRISVWTVHSHLKRIYEKLQVHTRTEAVLKYLEK